MVSQRTIRVRAPRLYAKQHAAIFDPARFSVIEASTKAGKTMGCVVWQIDQAFRKPGTYHWWVAPIVSQAKIAFKRAKEMLPRELYTTNETDLTITLANGSVWAFKGSDKPDSLYGEDVHSAVIDEASRCKEEAWDAVRSTLTATRGPARLIGNVKGRGNWFYKVARRAAGGAIGYSYHKLTAWDAVTAGVLDFDEIIQAKRDLTPDVFGELYEARPTKHGANPFGAARIERLTLEPGAWRARPEDAAVWGIDLADLVDWTVLIGLDRTGQICALERWQGIGWRATVDRVLSIVREAAGVEAGELASGPVRAMVDATGVGQPIWQDLAALEPGPSDDDPVFEPFKFTGPSKQKLMGALALDISGGEFAIPHGVISEELSEFEYKHTRNGIRYAAPAGLHDDAVCALALARAKWRAYDPVEVWW